jgi:hypothetical protein
MPAANLESSADILLLCQVYSHHRIQGITGHWLSEPHLLLRAKSRLAILLEEIFCGGLVPN